ncbi:PREDICTED: uncharacterized protein LOC109487094 [Branchiostoma belcheri]|uniref:Uncharacterized protein LOC109487094 n=1 Tax=Branchiostoma belcheri TaxID=7741 RepID=A0A6P5AK62_BRABE|nr:PREDICTED: uncharacterized protein LOC109487094 [Branchiostoma belcheri]
MPALPAARLAAACGFLSAVLPLSSSPVPFILLLPLTGGVCGDTCVGTVGGGNLTRVRFQCPTRAHTSLFKYCCGFEPNNYCCPRPYHSIRVVIEVILLTLMAIALVYVAYSYCHYVCRNRMLRRILPRRIEEELDLFDIANAALSPRERAVLTLATFSVDRRPSRQPSIRFEGQDNAKGDSGATSREDDNKESCINGIINDPGPPELSAEVHVPEEETCLDDCVDGVKIELDEDEFMGNSRTESEV